MLADHFVLRPDRSQGGPPARFRFIASRALTISSCVRADCSGSVILRACFSGHLPTRSPSVCSRYFVPYFIHPACVDLLSKCALAVGRLGKMSSARAAYTLSNRQDGPFVGHLSCRLKNVPTSARGCRRFDDYFVDTTELTDCFSSTRSFTRDLTSVES